VAKAGSMKRRAKFDRAGMLAIDPKCFGIDFFFEPVERDPFDIVGETAVVTIDGPMTHHEDWWCDSYDSIVERCTAAFASEAKSVTLVVNSPGGEASGCFDAARALRALADESGKPFNAFVDGMAASGGYALACSADTIFASDTSFVGSIGVIAMMLDATGFDRALGLKYTTVTSGARKADGNPHEPTTEGAIKALQRDVDSLAAIFFEWVASRRSGLDVAGVQALEAGVFHGAGALETGLTDVITTRAALLKDVSIGKVHTGPSAETKGKPMGWKDEMKKAAEDGDEDAKAALAALEADDKDGDEDKKSEKEPDGDEKKAEGDEPKKDDEDDKEKKKDAKAVSTSVDVAAIERIGEVERELSAFKAEKEEKERSELLASHDLTAGQIKILRAQPLEQMKQTLSAFAAKKVTVIDPSAASRISATRGRTQGTGGSAGASKTEMDEIDRKMGLAPIAERPRMVGRDHILPGVTMTKEIAAEVLETNRKAGRGIR